MVFDDDICVEQSWRGERHRDTTELGRITNITVCGSLDELPTVLKIPACNKVEPMTRILQDQATLWLRCCAEPYLFQVICTSDEIYGLPSMNNLLSLS
jgi:hypothetical protein